jgi:steroid delta-isomerase-like uncharacterized protein
MRCTGYHRPLEKEAIMDTARNKDLARRLYALINEGLVDQVADLVSPDYIEHDPLSGQGSGRDGVLDRFSMITTALAPHFTVDDLITEGDRIVVRWTNRGTHVGEFAGIPATSRTFTIAGIDIYRVADEQLCEHWHVIDQLGMHAQLGYCRRQPPRDLVTRTALPTKVTTPRGRP